MSVTGLTISKLAKAADVNVETVRYYQRVGLITQPDKPEQGYRQYPVATVSRIRFIKRAQRLGFTLGEAEELIKLSDGQCDGATELAKQKLIIINEHLTDLTAMKTTLENLISSSHDNMASQKNQGCAIIEALTDEKKLEELANSKPHNGNSASKVSNA